MHKDKIIHELISHKSSIAALIPGLKQEHLHYLDLSENSPYLKGVDLKDTEAFNQLIFEQVLKGKVGIGGFFEDRIIYRRSTHYDGAEPRSLHLGLDIWMPAGTTLYSPLKGIVHSFQDNQGFGNYGPTIIIEHSIASVTFYALYGHLDHESLKDRKKGDHVNKGEVIGRIGNYPENGDWPPHLHWQLMSDMLGYEGDFPGVAERSNRNYYLQYCIDPHYLLVMAE